METMPPSARLGQNFLVNREVAAALVAAVPEGPGPLLEIGPGHGILTELLLQSFPVRPLAAVEIDPELAAALETRLGPRLRLVVADIRSVPPAQVFAGAPFFLIGNLPYYLSKDVFDWLIAGAPWLEGGLVMVQREFAQKILAEANAQGVMAGRLFRFQRLRTVSPGSFSPPPKVVSVVLAFTRQAGEPPAPEFYPFLRRAFARRRATLANALAPDPSRAQTIAGLHDLGRSASTRAEELSGPEWSRLFGALYPLEG